MNMADLKEQVAKIVYDAMRFDREDTTPKWTLSGNSHANDHARGKAYAILDAIKEASSEFCVCSTCQDHGLIPTGEGANDCPDCVATEIVNSPPTGEE